MKTQPPFRDIVKLKRRCLIDLMFGKLLNLFLYWQLVTLHAYPQVWVEDYQYNGSEIDSSKWTYSTFLSAPNLNFTGSSMTIFKPTYSHIYGAASLKWYQSLPLNQSWSFLQRFKSNLIEERSSQMRMVVQTSSILTETIFYSNGSENSVGGAGNNNSVGEITNLLDNNYYWMGISHDANTKTLKNLISFDSSAMLPSVSTFQTIGSSVSTIGSENISADIGISWYFIMKGNYELTDFKIVSYAVPEPSALSLLAVGLGVVLRRRRRTV